MFRRQKVKTSAKYWISGLVEFVAGDTAVIGIKKKP